MIEMRNFLNISSSYRAYLITKWFIALIRAQII